MSNGNGDLSVPEQLTSEKFVQSGLEVMSPHKSVAIAQEEDESLPGIGFISTAWIGHLGKQDLLKKVRDETAKSVSKVLRSELRTLASTSLKAFSSIGMLDSDHDDVIAAVKLCKSYLSASRLPKATLTSAARAWKESDQPPFSSNPDKTQLATDVLGEQLVDTIKEKHRQPPHVSMFVCNCIGFTVDVK